MDRPDPRSPLVLDTRELYRRPGTMQELRRTATLDDDLGTDVISIKAGVPVQISHVKAAGRENWGKMDRVLRLHEGVLE